MWLWCLLGLALWLNYQAWMRDYAVAPSAPVAADTRGADGARGRRRPARFGHPGVIDTTGCDCGGLPVRWTESATRRVCARDPKAPSRAV